MSQRGRSQAARTPQTTAIGARSRQVPLGYKVLTTWLNGVFVLAGDDLDGDSGRIPKPCVVGSNPTGCAMYLPLSFRIPSVTRRHLDHPTRPTRTTSRGFMPSTGRLGNKAAARSPLLARPERCGASCQFVDGGWALIARPIRHFRNRQMSRPSGAFPRRTTRPERADNSTMCLPDALGLPCCRVRQ
jgi:hypothetical protein